MGSYISRQYYTFYTGCRHQWKKLFIKYQYSDLYIWDRKQLICKNCCIRSVRNVSNNRTSPLICDNPRDLYKHNGWYIYRMCHTE